MLGTNSKLEHVEETFGYTLSPTDMGIAQQRPVKQQFIGHKNTNDR